MKESIPVPKRVKLFAGAGEDDIIVMLSCLGAGFRTFKKKQESPFITNPFNRQQLADYLSVGRSAMSSELYPFGEM